MPRKRLYANNAERQRAYRAHNPRKRKPKVAKKDKIYSARKKRKRKPKPQFCSEPGCPALCVPGQGSCLLHQPYLWDEKAMKQMAESAAAAKNRETEIHREIRREIRRLQRIPVPWVNNSKE
jgi:hypothetical protein